MEDTTEQPSSFFFLLKALSKKQIKVFHPARINSHVRPGVMSFFLRSMSNRAATPSVRRFARPASDGGSAAPSRYGGLYPASIHRLQTLALVEKLVVLRLDVVGKHKDVVASCTA